jgi:hypothetical protein
MAALPASADFTGAAVTEAQFKTAITGQRDFLSGLLGTDGTIPTGLSTLKALCSAANARSAGSYSLLAADRGKVIHVTGSGASAFTVPVTSTTDFGIGWACAIRNDCSSGDITLTRSSTDTIDGGTSVVLAPGQSTILAITAAGKWVTIGKGSGAASEAAAGIVELATTAEAAAGTLTTHAVTPAGVLEAKKLSTHTATTSTTGASTMAVSGIPAWATRLTVSFSSISPNSGGDIYVELGDAGGFETGSPTVVKSAANAGSYGGMAIFVKTTGNTWAYFASSEDVLNGVYTSWSGFKTLSDTLTQARLRLTAGAFDAGTVTAYWE